MLSSGAGALGLRAGVKRRNQRTDDACGAAPCLCRSCWGQFSGPSLQYWAHGRHSLGVLFTSERHFRVIKKFLKPKIVSKRESARPRRKRAGALDQPRSAGGRGRLGTVTPHRPRPAPRHKCHKCHALDTSRSVFSLFIGTCLVTHALSCVHSAFASCKRSFEKKKEKKKILLLPSPSGPLPQFRCVSHLRCPPPSAGCDLPPALGSLQPPPPAFCPRPLQLSYTH